MVTSFKDLGKSTRELFDKHFKFGLLNFEFKTKTSNDITVTCGGKHDSKSQNVEGYLESKLKPTKGVSLKTKVDSAWIITSELEVEKKLHEGLSHDVVATVETESGKKALQVKNKFKHEMANLAFDLDFKTRYPQLTGAFVVPIPQFKQIVLGVQAVVDTEPFKLKKHVYALGFKHDNLRAHASLTDHSNVDINVYQEQKDVELGFKVGWNKETRETSFGAVVQYQPSSKSKFKVKVDQNAVIGLSYRLKLDSDTHLTLCTEVDGKNLESGGHKYGLMFEYGD
ncbi:Voltage-dependent anion-selective channel protein 2 [Paragonimus heterotremus]|uniref:Voltage-dependent anion-selective channel protein 2 n=1 Tax=Paragonimus heterotremus TaxID=100268 RepID=A0A8J4SJE8_9TREM|nr:Voltage-dependent anion-selective channel protein 2 [Paragonimus heterotremus]